MATTINLAVNGRPHALEATDPDMPLLYALRNELGLHGMHFGCGLAQCGACTVQEVDDGIWLVSFMDYDLGYIDLEQRTLQPLDNPFGPKVVTHVSGTEA